MDNETLFNNLNHLQMAVAKIDRLVKNLDDKNVSAKERRLMIQELVVCKHGLSYFANNTKKILSDFINEKIENDSQ